MKIMEKNLKSAIKKVEDAVHLKCKNAKEFDYYYLVECEPDNYDAKKSGKFLDGVYIIYKTSGKIKRYNPLIMNGK